MNALDHGKVASRPRAWCRSLCTGVSPTLGIYKSRVDSHSSHKHRSRMLYTEDFWDVQAIKHFTKENDIVDKTPTTIPHTLDKI